MISYMISYSATFQMAERAARAGARSAPPPLALSHFRCLAPASPPPRAGCGRLRGWPLAYCVCFRACAGQYSGLWTRKTGPAESGSPQAPGKRPVSRPCCCCRVEMRGRIFRWAGAVECAAPPRLGEAAAAVGHDSRDSDARLGRESDCYGQSRYCDGTLVSRRGGARTAQTMFGAGDHQQIQILLFPIILGKMIGNNRL